jgi:hypothetical protein
MFKRTERLLEFLRPKTQEEASDVIKEIAYCCLDYTRTFKPYKHGCKLKPGYEATSKRPTRAKPQTSLEKALNDLRSIRRSRQKLKDILACNEFDSFGTLTIKTDRYDADKSKDKAKNWFKNQQKRNGKFGYVVVPEFHKDNALHFHVLLKNYPGKLKEAINPHTGKPLKKHGRQIYNLPGYRLGFSEIQFIEQTPESRAKVGSYIAKYITKDMPQFFGKNRYYASHGLNRPKVIYNPSERYKSKPISQEIPNDYGVIQYFAPLSEDEN